MGVFRAAASHSGKQDSVAALPSPAGFGGGGTHSFFLLPLHPHSACGALAPVKQAAGEADSFCATYTRENE